uniref:Uncharacterized protein n=1 Tax=Trichogramma kaykai TaxID=54128 RepID=A0ABD2XLF0_9HYME
MRRRSYIIYNDHTYVSNEKKSRAVHYYTIRSGQLNGGKKRGKLRERRGAAKAELRARGYLVLQAPVVTSASDIVDTARKIEQPGAVLCVLVRLSRVYPDYVCAGARADKKDDDDDDVAQIHTNTQHRPRLARVYSLTCEGRCAVFSASAACTAHIYLCSLYTHARVCNINIVE